ncbi:MAG: hypothetical protein AVDCRST_MAG68-1917, partial [uncultured Gemmatimonadetes bacterium]
GPDTGTPQPAGDRGRVQRLRAGPGTDGAAAQLAGGVRGRPDAADARAPPGDRGGVRAARVAGRRAGARIARSGGDQRRRHPLAGRRHHLRPLAPLRRRAPRVPAALPQRRLQAAHDPRLRADPGGAAGARGAGAGHASLRARRTPAGRHERRLPHGELRPRRGPLLGDGLRQPGVRRPPHPAVAAGGLRPGGAVLERGRHAGGRLLTAPRGGGGAAGGAGGAHLHVRAGQPVPRRLRHHPQPPGGRAGGDLPGGRPLPARPLRGRPGAGVGGAPRRPADAVRRDLRGDPVLLRLPARRGGHVQRVPRPPVRRRDAVRPGRGQLPQAPAAGAAGAGRRRHGPPHRLLPVAPHREVGGGDGPRGVPAAQAGRAPGPLPAPQRHRHRHPRHPQHGRRPAAGRARHPLLLPGGGQRPHPPPLELRADAARDGHVQLRLPRRLVRGAGRGRQPATLADGPLPRVPRGGARGAAALRGPGGDRDPDPPEQPPLRPARGAAGGGSRQDHLPAAAPLHGSSPRARAGAQGPGAAAGGGGALQRQPQQAHPHRGDGRPRRRRRPGPDERRHRDQHLWRIGKGQRRERAAVAGGEVRRVHAGPRELAKGHAVHAGGGGGDEEPDRPPGAHGVREPLRHADRRHHRVLAALAGLDAEEPRGRSRQPPPLPQLRGRAPAARAHGHGAARGHAGACLQPGQRGGGGFRPAVLRPRGARGGGAGAAGPPEAWLPAGGAHRPPRLHHPVAPRDLRRGVEETRARPAGGRRVHPHPAGAPGRLHQERTGADRQGDRLHRRPGQREGGRRAGSHQREGGRAVGDRRREAGRAGQADRHRGHHAARGAARLGEHRQRDHHARCAVQRRHAGGDGGGGRCAGGQAARPAGGGERPGGQRRREGLPAGADRADAGGDLRLRRADGQLPQHDGSTRGAGHRGRPGGVQGGKRGGPAGRDRRGRQAGGRAGSRGRERQDARDQDRDRRLRPV